MFADCHSPASPRNGTVELADAGTTTYGSTAIQSCNTGFDLIGVTNITCGADGKWSNPSVTCTLKRNLHIVEKILLVSSCIYGCLIHINYYTNTDPESKHNCCNYSK